MRVRAIAVTTIMFVSGGLAPCFAAEPAGQAVAVVQSAAADGAAGARILQPAGPVFMGDLIRTNEDGQAQIRLLDDTRVVVGPNSQLTIDRFIYAGGATASEVTLNAVRGAFRFITGNSPKAAYSIDTPTATIGVRGSLFDVSILDDGTANLVFYGDGGVRYCNKQRPRLCTEIINPCTFVIVTPQQDFRWIKDVYERTAAMDRVFPFAFKPAHLEAGFRVDSTSCDIREHHDPARSGGSPPPPSTPPPKEEGGEEDEEEDEVPVQEE